MSLFGKKRTIDTKKYQQAVQHMINQGGGLVDINDDSSDDEDVELTEVVIVRPCDNEDDLVTTLYNYDYDINKDSDRVAGAVIMKRARDKVRTLKPGKHSLHIRVEDDFAIDCIDEICANGGDGFVNDKKSKKKTDEKPATESGWTCNVCGSKGNNGKFCSECGARKGGEESDDDEQIADPSKNYDVVLSKVGKDPAHIAVIITGQMGRDYNKSRDLLKKHQDGRLFTVAEHLPGDEAQEMVDNIKAYGGEAFLM